MGTMEFEQFFKSLTMGCGWPSGSGARGTNLGSEVDWPG